MNRLVLMLLISITSHGLGFTPGPAPTKPTPSIPGFFVGNSTTETGKRLMEHIQADAFLQVGSGKIFFDETGAYAGSLSAGANKSTPGPFIFRNGWSKDSAGKKKPHPRLAGATGGVVNYMVGSRSTWRTGLPIYTKLIYDGVWDQIDLEYSASKQGLRTRWMVNPGGDPKRIVVETGGATLTPGPDKTLVASMGGTRVRYLSPSAHQLVNGVKTAVSIEYRLLPEGRFGFEPGVYDPTHALIIEPVLEWSTFFGGAGGSSSFGREERVNDVAIDAEGNLILVGASTSSDFPITPGAIETWNGGQDAFVAKVNADLSEILYATFLGGPRSDEALAVAVDAEGAAYVVGNTEGGLPITENAPNPFYSDFDDGFITKLSADGSTLLYSSYLSGDEEDEATDVVVDAEGRAYILGKTSSAIFAFFITEGAYDEQMDGSSDAFVVKMNPTGTAFEFGTFLGGNDDEWPGGLALDGQDIVVLLRTQSDNFPTTTGAYDETYNGGDDIAVSKLSGDGTNLLISTYLGGTSYEYAADCALDQAGNIVVFGETGSQDFPFTQNAQDQTLGGFKDLFAASLDASLSTLNFATYIGGGNDDQAGAMALDDAGNLVLTGATMSTDFPTTAGVLDDQMEQGEDIFVTKLNAQGSKLIWSTFLGSNGPYPSFLSKGAGITLDAQNNPIIVGSTWNVTDFATTPDALQSTRLGELDGFVARLNSTGSAMLNATRIGGSGDERLTAITLDGQGAVYLAGTNFSSSSPVTDGVEDDTFNGTSDLYVAKLDAAGEQLQFATYYGGDKQELLKSLAIGPDGDLYLAGRSNSPNFPTTPGALDETFNSGLYSEAMLVRLEADGSDVVYATFLSENQGSATETLVVDDQGRAILTMIDDTPFLKQSKDNKMKGGFSYLIKRISADGTFVEASSNLSLITPRAMAIDPQGDLVIAGTMSIPFEATPGAYDESHNGFNDGFVTKLAGDTFALIWATYLGGSSDEYVADMGIDASGNIYVLGETESSDFPTTPGVIDTTHNGFRDLYIAKLSGDGATLPYGTFLGGEFDENAEEIGVDADGNALVVGDSNSTNFPTTPDAVSRTLMGKTDAVAALITPDGAGLDYATYLGGTQSDTAQAAWLGDGRMVVAGETESAGFPVTPGAYDDNLDGISDLFVVSFSYCTAPLISSEPQDALYCEGESVILEVSATASDEVTYQWRLDGVAIPGANQATYAIAAFGPDDIGAYTCLVATACETVETMQAVLDLTDELQTVPLQSVRTCPNTSVTFTAQAQGPFPLTYQWYRDGVPLSGEVDAQLTLDNVVEEDAGAYTCEIDWGCDVFTLEPANLEIVFEASSQSMSLGLETPVFAMDQLCNPEDVTVTWESNPPTPMVVDGNSVILDPPPTQTTTMTGTVTDGEGRMVQVQVVLLVASNPGYRDFNSDGCNNRQDLWDLMQFWNASMASDPNDDGFLDVRDLLYLNGVSSTAACP